MGLGEKEAKTYLALLELEVASVGEIVKASGLNRSSTYVTLEMLKKKSLVSITGEELVLRYVATSPEVLLRSVEDSPLKEQQKLERIKSLIPELKGMHKGTKSRPKVRVFEGVEGLGIALTEAFETKEKINRVLTSGDNVMKFIPDYIRD